MNLIQETDFDFAQYMEEREEHRVLPASDWLQGTIDAFFTPDTTQQAPGMLWPKTMSKVRFRPGEVSVWAGVNGHGKSMFLSQVTLDLCYQAERCMVASFEMKPVKQMQRMSRQAFGGRLPPREWLEVFSQWTDERLWLYDHVGAVEWRKVIAVMRYAVEKFGITQFVVDSMMKCVKGEDDYNGQKDFINELCAFAQAHQVHVHLVHHVKKAESEFKTPGKFDIKGTGAISDQVDNIFIVWRNKKAEQEQNGEPNCILSCEKQRHGEYEGKFGFWFDLAAQQYVEEANESAAQYGVDFGHSTKGYSAQVRA